MHWNIISLKEKEILTNVTTWMNLEDSVLSGITQIQKDCVSPFHEGHRVVHFIEAGSRVWLPHVGGGRLELL